ncbi:MAG TPA: MraY family glycosyltransferase [Vicinamibacterales bacterium]|nr:MraY family glycosyltransferase [Vicinamibacterales bacterium]
MASILTLLATATLARWQQIEAPSLQPLTPILIGAALVFGIGLLDDLRPVAAWVKLLVQTLAAIIVIGSGLRIETTTLLGGTVSLGLMAWPVTLLWIVGLTNGFNLIDGLDGLAAGIAVIAGATCATILVARGHAAEATLLTALVGAALGFLVYNFAPASIFLGDSGSLVFGFVLATTAITGWQKGATALAAGVPLLIFALPLADAISALTRRLTRRRADQPVTTASLLRQIAEPDREHIHHQLIALGWSTHRTVIVLYAVTGALSALALATASLD